MQKLPASIVTLLTLTAFARADAPVGARLGSSLFIGRYGHASDPITPRERLKGIWTNQTALQESNLPKERIQEANDRLATGAKDLISFWRASELKLASEDQCNKKAQNVWSTLEKDVTTLLGPAGMEELNNHCMVVFLQELITPCPDAVWGAPDFLKLNFTQEQKDKIDLASTQASEESEQRLKGFGNAVEKDPNCISFEVLEPLRRAAAAPRLAARSHMTADQLKKWDNYILSEAKNDAKRAE
jgi:hypothetical protein